MFKELDDRRALFEKEQSENLMFERQNAKLRDELQKELDEENLEHQFIQNIDLITVNFLTSNGLSVNERNIKFE